MCVPGIDAGPVQGSPQFHVIWLLSPVLSRFRRWNHIFLLQFITVYALHHRLFVVVVIVLLLLLFLLLIVALLPVLDCGIGGTLIGELGDFLDDDGVKLELIGYLIRRSWAF